MAAAAAATKSDMVTDVVFTGGELLADVDRLKTLCKSITGEKRVHANTSLTFTRGEAFNRCLDWLLSEDCQLDSVSVSCPMVESFDNFT